MAMEKWLKESSQPAVNMRENRTIETTNLKLCSDTKTIILQLKRPQKNIHVKRSVNYASI